jgi:hypothetical protein
MRGSVGARLVRGGRRWLVGPMSDSVQLPGRAIAGRITSNAGATISEHHWMDKSVAKLNIEHYKWLLASETDAAKRESIARLLAEEEAKLAKISKE